MSKVYVELVEEYICDALEAIRKMNENRDYSGLAAVVERIQQHASKMEKGLWRGKEAVGAIFHTMAYSDKDDAAKLKEIAKHIIEYNQDFEERFAEAQKHKSKRNTDEGVLDYYG
jgi:hypothetical protein